MKKKTDDITDDSTATIPTLWHTGYIHVVLYKRRYTVFVVSFELGWISVIGQTDFQKDYQWHELYMTYEIDITYSLLFCAFFVRIHLRSFVYIFHFNPNAINFEIIHVSLFRLFYTLSIKLLVFKKFNQNEENAWKNNLFVKNISQKYFLFIFFLNVNFWLP